MRKVLLSLMLMTAPSTGFAQSYLSDAAVCRRALNADRSGWVEDSDYAREATKRGLTFRACTEMPASNEPSQAMSTDEYDIEHPSFLRAALFFLTGFEDEAIKIQGDGALEERHQIFRNGGYSSVPVWYWQMKESGPCMIAGRMLGPPHTMILVDFNNMPSPRAAKYYPVVYGRTMAQLVFPTDTYCAAQGQAITSKQSSLPIAGTIKCDLGINITSDVYRRLKALDYIRANFCPGQPEPPPSPPEKRSPY